MFAYFLWNVSKTCQDRLTISRNIEIECLSHSFQDIFFRNSKHIKQVLTTSNFFSIFSIFLFLLVLFQLTPLWIVIYLIWNQWLCLIINVWLLRNSHFQWKKYIWLVNNPLFSVLGYFNLSQSEIIKDLTKIPTSANVSKN